MSVATQKRADTHETDVRGVRSPSILIGPDQPTAARAAGEEMSASDAASTAPIALARWMSERRGRVASWLCGPIVRHRHAEWRPAPVTPSDWSVANCRIGSSCVRPIRLVQGFAQNERAGRRGPAHGAVVWTLSCTRPGKLTPAALPFGLRGYAARQSDAFPRPATHKSERTAPQTSIVGAHRLGRGGRVAGIVSSIHFGGRRSEHVGKPPESPRSLLDVLVGLPDHRHREPLGGGVPSCRQIARAVPSGISR